MSILTDPREARYMEQVEQNRVINEKRAAAGLPPITIGRAPESYVETMMYTEREVPWHVDPDKDVPGTKASVLYAPTSEDAAEIAQINWEVATGQLWGGPTQRLVEGKVAIYRVSDGKVLGTASPRYQPIQNSEAFSFCDSLVDDGIMHYETAGSLYGGKKIWILARLEEDWTITLPNGEDVHSTYILVVTSHDGTGKLQALPTEVRAVCRNTVRLAFAGANFTASVTHKGNVQENLKTAREMLKVTTSAQRRYQEWMQQLAQTPVTEEGVTAVQDAMFGSLDEETSTRRQNQIQKFLEIYSAETERDGVSGYALAQAVTGFATHAPALQHRADGSEGMLSLLSGPAYQYTTKGFKALEEVSGLKLAEVS